MRLITGYDNRSVLYDDGNRYIRVINNDYYEEIKKVLSLCEKYSLFDQGVVETSTFDLPFSLCHKRYVTTYPHEWTANMYKDAVIYHLKLFVSLDINGLTLKDAIPGNIVFDGVRPVFVDFTSLVMKENLYKEDWLNIGSDVHDARYAVYDKMLVKFMIIPLLAMCKRDYSLAREMLSERACNCVKPAPSWDDLKKVRLKHSGLSIRRLSCFVVKTLTRLMGRNVTEVTFSQTVKNIRKVLGKKKYCDFIKYTKMLIGEIDRLDVSPPSSGYLEYYAKKEEDSDICDHSKWNYKQENVYKILSKLKPGTVLDIGANTGWFSILSESVGARVIATDIDESSIDTLYRYAVKNSANITPLLMSFDDLTKEIYGKQRKGDGFESRDFTSNPFILPATERFKSNVVLCLGLLHHLVLGMGKKINSVMEVLSLVANDGLVLEFVSLADDKIVSNPSYFNNINMFSEDNYSLDLVIAGGMKYFSSYELYDSYPATRKLIFFKV